MEKRNRNIMILSIVALVLVLVGVTYAYFSAQITGIESASTISMTAGRMGIVYSEGDENISVSNIYPREEAWITKTFTLTGYNTTDEEMKYNIGLNVETNEFANGYLTYDLKVLESDSGTPVSEKTNEPINGTGFIKFGKGTFKGANGDKHKYELKIYFKDNGENQNDAQGAVFNAKVYVSEYEPKRINIALTNDNSEEVEVITYDINKTKCLSFVSGLGWSSEDQETYCTGGEVVGTPINISNDVRDYGETLVNLNIIENVVYDDDNNITSYTINKANCLEKMPYKKLSNEDKDKYCSGETVKIPDDNVFNIASDLNNSIREDRLISNGVIENVEYTTEVRPVNGTEYTDGQYTYIYKKGGCFNIECRTPMPNEDGVWGVFLTDRNSTDPVTTELALSINDKPIVSMAYMFQDSQATSLDLSSFNTAKVTNMSHMFHWSHATSLDLSSFNTSNVTNMSYMFAGSMVRTLDLSSFNTSNVTDMAYMFQDSQAISLDLSSFNTAKVTNMSHMFHWSQATSIDLSSFNTSNVTNMSNMFAKSQATSLDLSSFDTSNVTDMSGMFADSRVTTLDLSNFDLTGKNIKYILDSDYIQTVTVKDENNMNLICNSGDREGDLQFKINGVVVTKPDNCKYGHVVAQE